MILYCDTSALIKRYLDEPDSALLRQAVAGAARVVVCRITWAEAMAAFARREREQPVDTPLLDLARQQLGVDWSHCDIIEITQPVVERAGTYAESFSLRGYDAVQLAAAKTLHDATGEVTFACFDMRLLKAAKVLGMAGVP